MSLSQNTTAEILSYADSNHYLVLIAREGEPAVPVMSPDEQGPMRFRGLAAAKSWLRDQGFAEAYLRMETAYDEMIDAPREPDRMRLSIH
ncbi:DUF6482 family protein [Motiliproteus sp. SC1-56]|uniref:DUF6482 family protein n=1 Tax=Motiliproteus sp. SC1-56 TaxID=2799565 RepID=UPI001A8F7602|nr:DUF6482 family protein [Motiliproteus sp. SC1-56]